MTSTPDTIVLIHGLWMTPRSWEGWAERYRSRGYEVIAPAWPGMEGEVEALNADPTPIAGLEIDQIVDHYEQIIRALPAPPIIMGHSFGGAFTQVLLDRGLGAVGVGVASATVKGVLDLPLSTIRATTPVLRNPFGDHKAVPLNEKQFHYAFANTLSQEQSDELFRRYHVPAASTVLREGAFANFHRDPPTKIHFERPRAPLLFIAFGEDHIIPPKASHHNMEKYAGSDGVVAFKEYPGRPHFPGVAGWEEVADFALSWALDPQPLDTREAARA
jgi:pimeloyl-ACP methyl ester carboxylesterase